MKGLAILGSTGSIGTNVLNVVEAFADRFCVTGLAAGGNVEVLAAQVARHRPRLVSVRDAEALERLSRLVDLRGVRTAFGQAGMVEVATDERAQMVVASAVGAVGLVPTYRALEAGKDVALANKETLVMAGELMLARARETGARLLPIDSEHCALHQCLAGRRPEDVRKITIDSATLMNKGLEVIEARWLFGIEAARIEVLIHPQSVIHSLVEFVDGTVLAQLGVTDMRMPIQYALSYPEVLEASIPGMDFTRPIQLEFAPPDRERFPCLALAYRALETGGSAPLALNAANEEAVAAFLEGRAPFVAIPEAIQEVLDREPRTRLAALEDVLEADRRARQRARQALARRAPARVH
jgi:1-deoxy-D-xylulose-5-phosphate reductoisomerase